MSWLNWFKNLNFSSTRSEQPNDGDDDDYYDYEIDYCDELSNGALVFKIIDDEYQLAGHIVVSQNGGITIIQSNFFDEFTSDERNYLEEQVKKFRDAR